jgi:DUF1009 family protein
MKLGMIAGNGRFPVLALEAARKAGMDVVAIGIKEEASPEIESLASSCYWISLGALTKLIDICKKEGISKLMMCGQVKHVKIFSSIVPDWRLAKLLMSLEAKNTDALIGGVAKVLADEGITLADSTLLLKDLLAPEGVLTKRKPSSDEERDITYGRRIAGALSMHDVGQSVAVAERAVVAVEAMEGTDAMLRRAASLVGPQTIDVMLETGTTALAVDAGRALLLDREDLLSRANAAGVTIVAAPLSD